MRSLIQQSEVIMAKKQQNVKSESVQSTISPLLAIFSELGITLTEDQAAQLETKVEVIKTKKQIHKKWEVVPETAFGAKTPTQMRQAIECVRDAGAVDMKTWAEKLAAYEGFKTQQPVERIIAFYKKRMLEEGLLRVVE